jgi:hypothetical protein
VVVEKEGAGKVLVLAASAMIAHVLLCRGLPMVGVRTLQSSTRPLFGFERQSRTTCANPRNAPTLAAIGMPGATGRFNHLNPKGSLKELVEKI